MWEIQHQLYHLREAVKDSLTYEEVQVVILDRQFRKLINNEVTSVMVLWRSKSLKGVTLEAEATIMVNYPILLPSNSVSASANISSPVSKFAVHKFNISILFLQLFLHFFIFACSLTLV